MPGTFPTFPFHLTILPSYGRMGFFWPVIETVPHRLPVCSFCLGVSGLRLRCFSSSSCCFSSVRPLAGLLSILRIQGPHLPAHHT